MSDIEKIFNRLFAPLCFYSNRYIKNLSEAEDIVQNVFIKVIENGFITKKTEKEIDGYFYTAVRNSSLDFLKSKYAKDFKAFPQDDLELLQNEKYFIKEGLTIDTIAIVQNAIKSLPDKCGKVIQLSYQDYSNTEIAEEMNVSVGTVKKHKKIGYKRLRELMSQLRLEYFFNLF